jgi:hypothetical protein
VVQSAKPLVFDWATWFRFSVGAEFTFPHHCVHIVSATLSASYPVGTGGYFIGEADYSPALSAEVRMRGTFTTISPYNLRKFCLSTERNVRTS